MDLFLAFEYSTQIQSIHVTPIPNNGMENDSRILRENKAPQISRGDSWSTIYSLATEELPLYSWHCYGEDMKEKLQTVYEMMKDAEDLKDAENGVL